jgi:hypothetical protein
MNTLPCLRQVIIYDDLRRGSMLNSGNNDREQNWLLLSPRVKRAQSDWQATVTLGCPKIAKTEQFFILSQTLSDGRKNKSIYSLFE